MSVDDRALDQAQKEYAHVFSELTRYDSDTQKLVSFISVVVTAVFTLGIYYKIDQVFTFTPVLSISLIQFLLTNNYAYRVGELYVYKLERFLRMEGCGVPQLYAHNVKPMFNDLTVGEKLLLPFNGAIAYTVLILLSISLFSTGRALRYLSGKGAIWEFGYLILLCSMVLYTSLSGYWSLRKLAVASRERTDTSSAVAKRATDISPAEDGTVGTGHAGNRDKTA